MYLSNSDLNCKLVSDNGNQVITLEEEIDNCKKYYSLFLSKSNLDFQTNYFKEYDNNQIKEFFLNTIQLKNYKIKRESNGSLTFIVLDNDKNINIPLKLILNEKMQSGKENYCLIIMLIIILVVLSYIAYNVLFGKLEKKLYKEGFIQSLVSFKGRNDVYLQKELISSVNSFLACLGPPGSGKSTFASLYYIFKYNFAYKFFQSSNSTLTFTKGLWMLKSDTRKSNPNVINRDIIDVEGFQVDDIKSWKYIMVISFLSTDILIFNRNERYDDVKKILKIIENSLIRMEKANIPKLLKTISIQIKDEDEISSFNNTIKSFNLNMDVFKGIVIKHFYLPLLTKKELKSINGNIEIDREYKEKLLEVVNSLTPEFRSNSAASLFKIVDDFNKAINGETGFNKQAILEDLKTDFYSVYSRYKKLKENEILSLKLIDVDNENETYDEFISKQNIDFSFEKNFNFDELTFYGSNNEYNECYRNLAKKEGFLIDKEILREEFNDKIRVKECQNDSAKKKILAIFNVKKAEINLYFSKIPFYGHIDNEWNCELDVETNLVEFKKKYEEELITYYENKKSEKRKMWEDQINRAKGKNACQAYGDMTCENGHKLGYDIFHHKDEGKLFWVDGPSHYVICDKCGEVFELGEHLICSGCGGRSNAKVKWTEGYLP